MLCIATVYGFLSVYVLGLYPQKTKLLLMQRPKIDNTGSEQPMIMCFCLYPEFFSFQLKGKGGGL